MVHFLERILDMNKIKNLIKYFIFIILVLPIIIFLYLFKLRIGFLGTDKIGDFTTISNNFYLDIKDKKISKYNIIWFPASSICNIFLFKNVEKHFVIFNSFLLHYTFEFLKKRKMQNFIIDKAYVNKKKVIQNFHLTNKYKSMISFKGFEDETSNIDKKYQIANKKIITFSVRSNHYHSNEIGRTSDRNYSIESLKKSLKFLKDRNYEIFKINSERNQNYSQDLTEFFHDPVLDKKNVIHSYLINKSELFISSPSGPVGIALMTQRPIILINFTPWHNLMYCNPHFIKNIIFKKYKNISSGKILSFKDVIEKKLYELNYKEDLISNGWDIVENSEDEIFNAIYEILFNKINNSEEINEKNKILKEFSEFYKNQFNLENINIKVSDYFFKNNKQLFYL